MVNPNVTRGQNYLGDECAPKLIIRQRGSNLFQFYFPDSEVVYLSPYFHPHALSFFEPSVTTFLFEPEDSILEPPYSTNDLQMCITCSPDRRRYHEFSKRGAGMYFMPCWNLDELLCVGAHKKEKVHSDRQHIYNREAITERYLNFGGIIRYVVPEENYALNTAYLHQQSAIEAANTLDVFAPTKSIEKVDENKENISHFLLQYDVDYGGKYEENNVEFTSFSMKLSSPVVYKVLHRKITDFVKADEVLHK